MDYEHFFKTATGHGPYDYQCRLAESKWPALMDIPTGLGKTAAVTIAWLWKRCILIDTETPRRLVYCLPMRVLVEQTRHAIGGWLASLEQADLLGRNDVSVYLLLGGEFDRDWVLYPEANAILIGTQDMLLSRALNRGYAAGRARWPLEFGLLNNDCMWVFDEVQLMGYGLATSAQLEAFQSKLWNPLLPCRFLWMSATINSEGLNTRDREDLGCAVGEPLTLTHEEKLAPGISPRLWAQKRIQLLTDTKGKSKPPCPEDIFEKHQPGRLTLIVVNTVASAKEWFSALTEEAGKRAKRKRAGPQPEVHLIHSRFRAADRKQKLKPILEFIKHQDRITGEVAGHPGMVLVTTQVIEAGFDISAARLWSEIAPWASCIQRLGRLNREGAQPDAEAIFWWPKADKQEENAAQAPNAARVGPYEKADLKAAEQFLTELSKGSQDREYRHVLDTVLQSEESRNALRIEQESVLRPVDLLGLFPTEPDLAGGFTNISQFVRDQDRNADVHVFWRPFDPKSGPSETEGPALREELVSVPFWQLRRFLSAKNSAWEWNFESACWERRTKSDVHPGMTLVLACSQGGYSEALGWTGEAVDRPSPVHVTPTTEAEGSLQAFDWDPESESVAWRTLPQHSSDVESEISVILKALGLEGTQPGKALLIAARWHDRGKSLDRWQQAVINQFESLKQRFRQLLDDPSLKPAHEAVEKCLRHIERPSEGQALWAKWPDIRRIVRNCPMTQECRETLRKKLSIPFRPGLRHEAASALAAWDSWLRGNKDLTALAIYLIASHHGKVRTTLQSISNRDEVFGLCDGDVLPACAILMEGEASLQFEMKKLGISGTWSGDDGFVPGQPSWTAMLAELLGNPGSGMDETFEVIPESEPRSLGPFKLAYLEALLRAADARASRCLNGGREQ